MKSSLFYHEIRLSHAIIILPATVSFDNLHCVVLCFLVFLWWKPSQYLVKDQYTTICGTNNSPIWNFRQAQHCTLDGHLPPAGTDCDRTETGQA